MKVDWLILADSTQIVGDKLYMLGGGWDRIYLNQSLPVTHPMAVAIAFLVPWDETNRKHVFEMEFLDGDGKGQGKSGGNVEVGRPPGAASGQSMRTQIAFNMGLKIKAAGSYMVVVRVNE